jgi:hypothetical protein
LIINGDAKIDTLHLEVNSSSSTPAIVVTGVASIGGSLTVELSGALADHTHIAVLRAGSLQGNFTDVQLLLPSKVQKNCKQKRASQRQSGTLLSVVLSVHNTCTKLSAGIIAAIVIGAIIGLGLISGLILILIHRAKPRHTVFDYQSLHDASVK